MKAAALGHQYLTLKSFNQHDNHLSSGGRFRGSRKTSERQSQNEPTSSSNPSTVPLTRRAPPITTTDDSSLPSVAIYGRCVSDSNHPYVIYERDSPGKGGNQKLDGDPKPYSLVSILSKRRGSRDEDDKLSDSVRKFYKKQDSLIDSFEEVQKYSSGQDQSQNDILAKKKQHIEWLIRATILLNCSLLVAKIVAAVFSRSLSIISSVVDSAVDSASACLLFWAVHVMKKPQPYTYPKGRTRLEPVIIVILSVVMVSASVQVIYQSIESLINDINHFTKNSTGLPDITMGPIPITVMCVTVVCKATLSFLCFQISNPTMHALAQDHLNDVFSNIVALVCGIIAAKALDGSLKKTEVVVIDPIGAILISLYIIFCWLKQLHQQIRNLSGYKAEPEFLQKITWFTLHHSPLIQKIDTVRAFHFGTSFLVEVEIILPETMSLKEAHDIGASLQEKLERIPEVEIAFVHLDYTVEALDYNTF